MVIPRYPAFHREANGRQGTDGPCHPPDRGRILLAALCVALTAISGAYFVRSLLKPDTGLVVMYPEVTVEDGRVIFSPPAPFSAAAASGLRARRDQILSIDGVPVGRAGTCCRPTRGSADSPRFPSRSCATVPRGSRSP